MVAYPAGWHRHIRRYIHVKFIRIHRPEKYFFPDFLGTSARGVLFGSCMPNLIRNLSKEILIINLSKEILIRNLSKKS